MKLIKAIGKLALLTAITFSGLLKKANAQFVNSGSSVNVDPGAILYTGASFTNTANGIVINNGSIIADSSIINDAGASLSGNGNYTMRINFINNGTFDEGTSMLEFIGADISTLKNVSGNIYKLQVNKAQTKYVTLLDNENVLNSVNFVNDNNWINLGSKILTLGANCSIVNYNDKKYFVTNGTGSLKKINVKNIPFTFPVGFSNNTYNPLTITENGTADNYSVRCLQHALLNGSSGTPISSGGIDASWLVNESTAGGANATIQATWKLSDELTNFDYTHCMVSRYTGTKWSFSNNQTGTATGSTYRTISKSGFSSFGYFTVLSSANPTLAKAISSPGNMSFAGVEANSLQLKVYPTIVQNNLNIDVPVSNRGFQKMNVSIVDAAGKIVWQKQKADYASQKILLPDLPTGLYNVLIEFDRNKFVQKILIAR